MKKNSRIFVAGHRGLVGSAIWKSLENKGYSYLIGRTHKELDLEDPAAVREFFDREKPEYVFLAAAFVGGIIANSRYRADFIFRNLQIQQNVIGESFRHGVSKLLFLGSTCIYPREAPQPMKENALLTSPLEYTNEPYAIAKIAGLKMCESFNLQYGTNYIAVMPTNLYGPNDNFHLENSHVLPAMVRKIHLAKCLMEGDWNAVRKDLNARPVEQVDDTAEEKEILAVLAKYGITPGSVELWGTGRQAGRHHAQADGRLQAAFPGLETPGGAGRGSGTHLPVVSEPDGSRRQLTFRPDPLNSMTSPPDNQDTPPAKASLWALSPLLVFFLLYLVIFIAVQDFYAVPVTVAFMAAAVWAVFITRGKSMAERVDLFSSGVANRNILMMVWIFVLAGAFAQSARDMGAIDATVQLTLRLLPDNLLFASVFIASCFISLSVGTSVGTIVALAPVATGLAQATQVSAGMMTAIVVGGAFFGDNLSFISDTTIAATRTQGCAMRDKFRANIKVALPAALLALACYILLGWNVQSPSTADISIEWMKVFPYLLVLVTALAGIHVMVVLTMGLLATGLIGIGMGYFSFMAWFQAMGSGMTGMGELIIVTLLAGGVLSIIRFNGGIAYIIGKITAHIHSRRGAEFSIAGLVSLANLCTANNTIAIITAGPIAKEISDKFHIPPKRSASILDTFSCLVQGVIPYGAQMLMAAGISQVSPLLVMKYLYYPLILGICSTLAIALAPGGTERRGKR